MATRIVEELQKPGAFPWNPPSVEMIETHISWVFLAGERVVKVKRPVDFGFVDFTELERRRHFCQEEVRLNQRLTTGVYLGVAPIVSTPNGLQVDGEGEIVDWCTIMRRLPSDRMLDVLIRNGAAPDDLAELLSARLIPFHRQVPNACHGQDSDYLAVITENLDQLEVVAGAALPPFQLDLVCRSMRLFIEKHRSMLFARLPDWLREGHGDLRTEHICLESDGTVQIFDCVEFSENIRCADVASDLAFLLMDLRRLGAEEPATELIRLYRAAGFDLPDLLIRIYSAHRALVRAKVACLEAQNASNKDSDRHRFEAADFLNLATAAALTTRPVLIAISGLSGSGKSTVAKSLARALGASVHSSDIVRKRLTGLRPSQSAAASWRHGVYAPMWTAQTYEQLRALAAADLESGCPTIIDATLLDDDERNGFAGIAADGNVPFCIIETICDERVLLRRLRARQKKSDSVSDADVEIYRRQRSEVERNPPVLPAGAITATVETSSDGPASLDPVFQALSDADLLDLLSGNREDTH